jgi:hypothetical protein
MTNKYVYEIIDYFDVWGNQEEGWQVNNERNTGIEVSIPLPDDEWKEDDTIEKLKSVGFLSENASIDNIEVVWNDEERAEILEKETDKPLGCLIAKGC